MTKIIQNFDEFENAAIEIYHESGCKTVNTLGDYYNKKASEEQCELIRAAAAWWFDITDKQVMHEIGKMITRAHRNGDYEIDKCPIEITVSAVNEKLNLVMGTLGKYAVLNKCSSLWEAAKDENIIKQMHKDFTLPKRKLEDFLVMAGLHLLFEWIAYNVENKNFK